MPYGQPAQLANLTPWKPGNKAPRRSADVSRAIRQLRKLSPEAVTILAAIMRDENEETALRIRAAEIILNKAVPSAGSGKGAVQLDTSVGALRIEIVDPQAPEIITVKPQPVANGRDHTNLYTDDSSIRLTFAGDEEN